MKLYQHSIHKLHKLLKSKDINSLELTKSVLQHIEEVEPHLNAFITVMKETALEQAKEADKRIASGNISALTGIPLGIKDLICIKGASTTCASKILKNFISPYDATVIEKLRQEGAIFIGKLNMDEFAMGSSTETSYFGPTKNPWNLDYIPGGSSGGSAAATAAGECIASLGSDTGGSIRQPASHCGIVGLKPTYGRVSRYGLVAFASSLDQIGPMTRDVRDCSILLEAISGYDRHDSTSVLKDVPHFSDSLGEEIKGLRIGIPQEYFGKGLDPDIQTTIDRAIRDLESLGARVEEISLPHTEYVVAVYYIIAPAEASSNLARYDGVKYGYRTENSSNLAEMLNKTRTEGFGKEVIRRIMLGTYSLSAGYYDAYYKKASQVRTLLINDFKEAFDKCDILLTPISPIPPFKIGEKIKDPLTMYLTDIYTIAANLSGIPGLSLPYGKSKAGLPIGIQFLGNYFDEETLLKTAFMLEQEKSNWTIDCL